MKNTKITINRSHLIKILANQYTNSPNKTITTAVKHMFEIMTHTLSDGNKIELRGFGCFSTRFRSSRTVRNPKTGEKVKLYARYVVHFKPGKELNAKINKIDQIKIS